LTFLSNPKEVGKTLVDIAVIEGSKKLTPSGPGPPQKSPYSNLVDSKSVGPGKKFTQSQKSNILDANKKANGGVLKSDLSGKKLDSPVQSKKGVKANMNQAEVDHKNAKSKGGANSYKNAQVLSKEENLKKSNKQ
jgi:hypothetical protein